MKLRPSFLMVALALLLAGAAAPAGAQEPRPPASSLSFEEFASKVQPIFVSKREGLMRCVTCHAGKVGTRLRLQELPDGATTWSADDARKNFASASTLVKAGSPMESRLLLHPLDRDAGGDPFHGGGKHWLTQTDPEWQTLAAWVRG
jgi:hypothetical protein